jgi:UDP-2,4-diacetamido-2,4,6-trideoxy-beta-L-altropyranose hydrolase
VRILFRTVAGPAIGLGHLRRCMTLASGLQDRGHRCEFLIDQDPDSLTAVIADRFRTVPSGTMTPAIDGARGVDGSRPFDWLVVDDYSLDARWESEMREFAARILVIDDLADRAHDCEVLLDQVVCRAAEDYAGLVGEMTTVLVGPTFVLLRPRFAQLRAALSPRRHDSAVRSLYVSMGGTDPHGRILAVLRAIDRLPDTQVSRVRIVISSAAEGLEELRAAAAAMRTECTLHVDASDVADLMVASGLAVTAGGMTSYELACLGIPSLIIPATQVEADAAQELARWSDAMVMGGQGPGQDFEDVVLTGLQGLITTVARGSGLRGPAERLDGRGLERVIDVMESYED